MIVIYADKQCIVCNILKVYLDDKNFDYRMYYIGKDVSIEEIQEMYPFFSMVPFILKDGEEINLSELERLIDKHGN